MDQNVINKEVIKIQEEDIKSRKNRSSSIGEEDAIKKGTRKRKNIPGIKSLFSSKISLKHKSIEDESTLKHQSKDDLALLRINSEPAWQHSNPPGKIKSETDLESRISVSIRRAPSKNKLNTTGQTPKSPNSNSETPKRSFSTLNDNSTNPLPSSKSLDPNILSVSDKRDLQRTFIFEELLQTEQTYIATLTKAVEGYLNPLRAELQQNPNKYIINKKPLTMDQLDSIFSNIEMILGFNKTLCEEFEKRFSSWSSTSLLGDIFLKLTPFLKLYTEYSNNYDKAIELLKECKKCPAFQEFLAWRRTGETNIRPSLESLLINPIQRIPRYKLLLKDLIKNTDSSHPDYNNLSTALKMMEEVAQHIENRLKTSENVRKLVAIENAFKAGGKELQLITSTRFLQKEGTLTEICHQETTKKPKPVYMYLFNDLIVFGHVLSINKYLLKCQAPIVEVKLSDIEKNVLDMPCFLLEFGGKQFTLACSSLEEKIEWMNLFSELKDKINESKNEPEMFQAETIKIEIGRVQKKKIPEHSSPFVAKLSPPIRLLQEITNFSSSALKSTSKQEEK